MKIYDAFLFFNELDLLEIRLNLLNDQVDYFVISESDLTFSGKPKPLYYSENKDRFKQFEKKIIHQVITDNPTDFTILAKFKKSENKDEECMNNIYSFIDEATNFPKNELHWGRDFYQRECLHRALLRCDDDDIIIFSDVDEIPNPDAVKQTLALFPSNEIYTLRQKEFDYYLNMYREDNWMGPRIALYSSLKTLSLNKIRAIREGGRTLVDSPDVQNGGWHFTSLGGTEKIIQKIESWGHQELNTDAIKKNVTKNVKSGKDIFNRPGIKKLQQIKIDEETFPKWLVENIGRYSHLINISGNSNEKSPFIGEFFKKLFNR
jgi:beta-1,4-mannosyl-glycoprotein beta-1,4-N-acetylglucosaminyltransferase